MNGEPPHFDELCRQIGLVVLQAQILEHNIALFLATSRRLELQKAVQEVHHALEDDNRKTIERLLMEVRKNFPLDPTLDARIWSAKEERNWLVHRLQREAPRATLVPTEAAPVFLRIQKLSSDILGILVELDKVGDGLMQKHGFDNNQIHRLAQERIKKLNSQPPA